MSKWRKVGSANACAPSMVRAKQRTRTASRRLIRLPPCLPFPSFVNRRRVKAFAMNRRLAKNKPPLQIQHRYRCRTTQGPRVCSVPGLDENQSAIRTADRYRQRGLQRVKEILHVAGAEAGADPHNGT